MAHRNSSTLSGLHGLLGVWKPMGVSSKDVSRAIELALKGRLKLGHVGTLDPMAEGVLPLLLGKATRLQDLFLDSEKEYEFDIEFGYETDTLDREGEVIQRLPFQVDEKSFERVVAELVGSFDQVPPIYSAVKVSGKPLYFYARKGIPLPVPIETLARPIQIFAARVVAFSEKGATIVVACSKGTYIRSIGLQLAKAVGTCATVTRLVRTRSSGLCFSDVTPLQVILDTCRETGSLGSLLTPIEKATLPIPKVKISDAREISVLMMGQQLCLPGDRIESFCVDGDEVISLLLDGGGAAFGLGKIWQDASSRVLVKLKRSLA